MGKRALSIDAGTFACFLRNPRGGDAKPVKADDIESFMIMKKEHSLGPLVAHSPYTMNACSADPSIRDFAMRVMKEDIRIMDLIPGNYYNFHPGSHVKQGVDIGIGFIAGMLNDALFDEQSTIVLLETMSGKGSEIGRSFEELRRIIDSVNLKNKIGVCFDTCHVWDAGYDIVGNLDGVLDEFDRVIGIEYLKAVHLNDSMNTCGSHKDRHAKIGEGHIGLEAIVRTVCHPALKNLPFILETPNDMDGYASEIRLLKSRSI